MPAGLLSALTPARATVRARGLDAGVNPRYDNWIWLALGDGPMADVSVNGRRYRPPPRAAVVVCFDGCDPAYIERGIADGILPTLAAFRQSRFCAISAAVVPPFTT